MSFFDRFFGAPDIQKLKQRTDVQGLLRALEYSPKSRDEGHRVRRGAIEALAEIGEPALQPTCTEYLRQNRKSSDRNLLAVLREIGKRTGDPRLRQQVLEKLGELMDLRKENHAVILQSVYSLACRGGNLPTFPPAAHAVIQPRLQDPNPAVRFEGALGMLIISILTRDFRAIEQWFDQVQAQCRAFQGGPAGSDDPGEANSRRTARALGEAGPLLAEEYLRVKAVTTLFYLYETWKDNQTVREAVEAALAVYPPIAVPQILDRLEKNPQDAFAVETLAAIGKRMLGTPQESSFIEKVAPFLEAPSWDIRQAIAQILRALEWSPPSMATRINLLIAARNFSPSAWADVQIDRDGIEQIAAIIDDPRYPARIDLVRHISIFHGQINDREARFRLRGVLARCLQSQPPQVHLYVVRGLAALDWQPGSGTSAVIYWTYLGEWERVVAIATYTPLKADLTTPSGTGSLGAGAAPIAANAGPAVDVLIECLSSPDMTARKTAARALSAIYQSGVIDGPTRQRILATSSRIDEFYKPLQPSEQ